MHKTFLLFFIIISQVACKDADTIRKEAEALVQTDDGFMFQVDAFIWRDFMPGTSDNRLKVNVKLVEVNRRSISETFELNSVILLNGDKKWNSKFTEIHKEQADQGIIEATANKGPDWDVGAEVDVIAVFVRKKDAKVFKIIVEGLLIQVTR